MKHWFMVVALVCFGSTLQAKQFGVLPDGYLRLIDIAHPMPILGALLDPRDLNNSEAMSLLPLVTHSTRDGCLLPSVVCEDWAPVVGGASMNAGKITVVAGSMLNVLPWMQSGARALVPAKWTGLVNILTPDPKSTVTFSAGAVIEYRQITNKGYFKIPTGLALHF